MFVEKPKNKKNLLEVGLKKLLLRMIKSFYYADKIWKDLPVLI